MVDSPMSISLSYYNARRLPLDVATDISASDCFRDVPSDDDFVNAPFITTGTTHNITNGRSPEMKCLTKQ